MENLTRPRFWFTGPGCFTFLGLWIVAFACVATLDIGGRAAGILPTLEPTATPTVTPTLPPTAIPTATPIPPDTPTASAVLAPTPLPIAAASTPVPYGISYAEACEINEDNMTDPQIEQHAARLAGLDFTGWRGWVYNVESRFDGSYNLEIAMEPRSFLWGRDVVVENISGDLMNLSVEQEIVFNGRIDRAEVSFRLVCNPLVVEQFELLR